jgi:hypothetical protein
MDLNLADLGLAVGDNWTDTYFEVSLDASIRAVAPAGALTHATAVDTQVGDWMVTEPLTATEFFGGTPATIQLSEAPAARNQPEHDLRHVEEQWMECFAGAIARSLDWLNRHHSLGLNPDAQALFYDLRSSGISTLDSTKTAAENNAEFLKKKMAYTAQNSSIPIITKVIDLDNRVANDPALTQQEGGDLWGWLKQEWEDGEDVELIYRWKDPDRDKKGAHMVTVRDIFFKTNGDPMVILTQCDKQRVDDGEPRIRYWGVWKDSSGNYCLGPSNRWIVAAVSESIPEPCTLVLFSIGGLMAVGRRRRYRPDRRG